MGFFDSLKKGLTDEEEKPAENTLADMVRTSNSPNSGRARIVIVEPLKMEECNALVECIRHGLIVVISVENVEAPLARRIVDFLTGATRAIDGRSLKINRGTYIFAPNDIDIATRRKDKAPAASSANASASGNAVSSDAQAGSGNTAEAGVESGKEGRSTVAAGAASGRPEANARAEAADSDRERHYARAAEPSAPASETISAEDVDRYASFSDNAPSYRTSEVSSENRPADYSAGNPDTPASEDEIQKDIQTGDTLVFDMHAER